MPNPIHWLPGDQVCIIDGWGYGVDKMGRTICIGKEEDIIKNNKEALAPSPTMRRTRMRFKPYKKSR